MRRVASADSRRRRRRRVANRHVLAAITETPVTDCAVGAYGRPQFKKVLLILNSNLQIASLQSR